ncbi:hypothetical protein J1C81_04815 [Streptococcus sanguinis]|uniref:Uncharacterized protein n=1 Tax=Streptococcus sanguinis SK330 TaxID=888813 RepID=F2C5P4_STRSA|nr:hypothetical protein [Streptococcus sanguinis]EGF16227.1 hypothetical protein HMPREF9386_0397 [Streptococcus sanguinis SK330]KAF1307934.1 hypothetical protein I925_01945 [Streptococcus sanguinis OH0843]
MTNARRAVLALSLGVLLLLAAGILLQVHFWRMIILLGLFFFAEVFIIWYSGSKSKSQISSRQSLELFWLYIKRLKILYIILMCVAIPFVSLSSSPAFDLFFVLELLVFLLLSNYIFSSYGIQPPKKERILKV